MATILDVARLANVSAMTVSRVINGSARVNEQTRLRVQEAMEQLQFYPNSNARGLVLKETRLLALLISDITNPFFTTLARGAEDEAKRLGYRLIFGNSDEDVSKEKEYLEMLLSTRVDGVLIAPSGDDSLQNLQLLQNKKLPFVIIDRDIPGLSCDKVLGDSLRGTHLIMEHLIAQGHRRIAFLSGPKQISTSRLRLQGYAEALAKHGIPVDPRIVVETNYKPSGGEEAVQQLIRLANMPTAIFAANNFLAVGAIKELREHGLRVPEDLSVACFDDLDLLSDLNPFLTVAAQPSYDFGVKAVELLIDRIGGSSAASKQIVLPPQLVIRQSSRSI